MRYIQFKVCPVLGAHQVEIETLYATDGQMAFKQGAEVFLLFEKEGGQLVGEYVILSGIADGEAGPQGGFALGSHIAVGGIRIVESRVYKGI